MSTDKPLRLWPGILLLAVQWLFWFALPLIEPDAGLYSALGSAVCGLLIVLWWLLLSRARWYDRLGIVALMIAAVAATRPLLHTSIQSGGMGLLFYFAAMPWMTAALVGGAVLGSRFSPQTRRVMIAAGVVLVCAAWTLLRTEGVSSSGSGLHLRWTPTPEERLLASAAAAPPMQPAPPTPAPPVVPETKPAEAAIAEPPAPLPAAKDVPPSAVEAPAEWPGFRGPGRDSVVRGVHIETDWAKSRPVAIWRKPVGPGWSSFAVHGDRIYTQEQRGEDEIVACYKLSSGEPVWMHRDSARFWESNAGAGPRATPLLSGGRVYSFGATGILNALDAASGKAIWSRNVATETGRKVPDWGFSASPLVIDDAVVVAASGTLAAYDAATGQPRWTGARQPGSYSSPHRATVFGLPQVLLLSGAGVTSFLPATGAVVWAHAWEGGTPIVQPALLPDGDILIHALAMSGGAGLRRLAIHHEAGTWTVKERWTSNGLKPYFNDFVVHNGHAYGFDGSILSCIDLADGKRKWKGGRYGNGQLVLFADQDALLVLSEEGELALVSAAPDRFHEFARIPAINGKTWNHPAVVRDTVLVRNGEEMAAYRLPRR